MRMQLLVDSPDFWRRMTEDIRSARDHVLVQTLSLEGDSVGQGLMRELQDCSCADRRILVDTYTKLIISDRFLYTPRNLMDASLREEVRETHRMIERARRSGIGVKFTNPAGPFLFRFPARNHKKIVVVDGKVSYIGGINFSEHNFLWHDLMLRIEDPAIALYLKDDFACTWREVNAASRRSFPGIELHLLDGRSNEEAFQRILELIRAAKERIFVESPYLTFPFTEKLAEAVRRGVHVTIVSPGVNNHRSLQRYAEWESARLGFDLRLYGGMTHMKAMLIDDGALILGSSNFDWLSYRFHQEIVAVITDKDLIADFQARIMAADLEQTVRFSGPRGRIATRIAHSRLWWAAKLSLAALGRG